jgi:hypothetical protein
MLDVLQHDNLRAVLKGPASSQALKTMDVQMERMKGGKTGEDSHSKFNVGWKICSQWLDFHKTGHQWLDFRKFLLAVVARFKAFKTRVPSNSCGGKRPQRVSASKAKSSVLSQLSSLENVVFNDFIDDELDSEDVSEKRASASLPDSVPIESERAACEAAEMTVIDAVRDYEADPNVMLEDVPQDIVIKTLKVSCACVPVLVFVCVCVSQCVCACARRRICVRENLHLHFLIFVCVCSCNREGTSHTSSRVDGRLE